MAFVKGQSGNPGGRPRGTARLWRDTIAAQKRKDPNGKDVDGWTALILTTFDAAMAGDMAAVKICFERAEGMPKQTVDVEVTETTSTINWSAIPVEKRRELLAALDTVGALAAGDDNPTEH